MNLTDPPTWSGTLPTPKRLAKDGYIAYLAHGAPTNKAPSHAGWGRTPTEAYRAATYWANQLPWIVVRRAALAPAYAADEAERAAAAGKASAHVPPMGGAFEALGRRWTWVRASNPRDADVIELRAIWREHEAPPRAWPLDELEEHAEARVLFAHKPGDFTLVLRVEGPRVDPKGERFMVQAWRPMHDVHDVATVMQGWQPAISDPKKTCDAEASVFSTAEDAAAAAQRLCERTRIVAVRWAGPFFAWLPVDGSTSAANAQP